MSGIINSLYKIIELLREKMIELKFPEEDQIKFLVEHGICPKCYWKIHRACVNCGYEKKNEDDDEEDDDEEEDEDIFNYIQSNSE